VANKITLKSLAVKISKTIASRDNVTKHDRNNSMDMTILETLHQIGHPEQGLPGVRPHILKMVKNREITVFSSRGGLQPVQLSDVSESNFERWSTSNEDADKVKRKLNIKPQDAPENKNGASANVKVSEVGLATDDAPVFHRKARCEAIPLELLTLPADACIRYVYNIGGIRGEGRTRAGEYLQELASIIKRQAEGFFTIDEAAQILAESSGGDVKTRKAKLWRAIKEGRLDVLDTDDRERVLDLNHVRDFIHLLRASDIVAAGFIFPIQLQAVPVVAKSASDEVEFGKAGPEWSLKTIKRAPGYRWPLYLVLKDAHIAKKPCPTARAVLEIWTLNPPPDVQVMPDGVKYNDGLGNPKEANLKAIQQAIKNLKK